MEKPVQHISGSVNIIGANAKDFPETELCRILTSAGLSVNSVFPSRCELQVIKKAPKAEFNILMNRNSRLLAERMKVDFGIPYIRFEQSYTYESITEQYRQLGDILGTDIMPYIRPAQEKFLAQMETSVQKLKNSSVIISLSNGRVFNLAQLLIQSGMQVRAVGVNDLTDLDYMDAARLSTIAPEILVARNISWYPLDECIAALRPDFFLAFSGPDATYCARHGVNHRNIMLRPHKNGFEAAARILETLTAARPGFSTLGMRDEMKAKEGIL
jgi:nitrogenase molybdenum-iron protein alpha/beta subunit